MSKELNRELNHAIKYRPFPFKASYHGDSTIINDANGHWVSGQVPREQAEQIALAMTEAAKEYWQHFGEDGIES